MTYAAPLFVTPSSPTTPPARSRGQTVFMGDFPVMTRKGTFIINGNRAVVVSQLVRSPGVYYKPRPRQDLRHRRLQRPGHPRPRWRGSSSTSTSARTVGVRIDRQARQPVTVLLKAVGWSADRSVSTSLVRGRSWPPSRRTTSRPRTRRCSTSIAAASGRAADPRSAQALLENLFFNPKRYDLAKSAATRSNRKLGTRQPISHGTLTEDDIVATIEYLIRLHAGERATSSSTSSHFGNRRLRTVGELIQNQIRVGCPVWSAVSASGMTTQDVEANHAADPDQHPAHVVAS